VGKKKKTRKAIRNHERLHQRSEDFIESHVPRDLHVVPEKRGWHVPHPWCHCSPTVHDEDPRTGKKVYMHKNIVH